VAGLLGIDPDKGDLFPARLLIIVTVTAAVMLTVTMLTKPSDPETLRRFYERVRPPGRGFAAVIGREAKVEPLWPHLLNWGLASAFVIAAMLAVGKFLLGFPWEAAGLLAAALVVGWVLLRRLVPRAV
jgi:hypothetical protein